MSDADWDFAPPAFRTIRLEGVSRVFGRTHALYECTTSFNAGEAVVLVGPNGAGKTTLLQLVATLDRPSSGTITFDERHDAVQKRHVIRPHVGLVAHDSLLYPELSGVENLEFTARLHGRDPRQASLWLERVGLKHAANALVAGYSRGMKQRLSIARALLPEPTLVLFDEPLTGLDRSARDFLFSTMQRLRSAGRALVVVTHHLDWPTESLNRAIVLDAGRIRYDGPIQESLATLYTREVRV